MAYSQVTTARGNAATAAINYSEDALKQQRESTVLLEKEDLTLEECSAKLKELMAFIDSISNSYAATV